jgi:hypothetical protein
MIWRAQLLGATLLTGCDQNKFMSKSKRRGGMIEAIRKFGAVPLASALLCSCVTGNDFMTRAHKANEYRWIADITADGGGYECGAFFQRATVRIKDTVMTIWPYSGYLSESYSLDLKGLNADGSGRVESTFAEDETTSGKPIMHKTTFHFDAGVGPRRMIQHSNYVDRCSWTWTPEDVQPTGAIITSPPAAPGVDQPSSKPSNAPVTVFQPTVGRQ